jgi:RNA polymerase sigma-70 factor (ECF subfamily)
MRIDFEHLVREHYQPLYRFALSLSGQSADACDLTQQTFALWAERGHQLRDIAKAKSWLFTTLYREFLRSRRRGNRFPHLELVEAEKELPVVTPDLVQRLESEEIMEALNQVDEAFRAPLSLFYIGSHSYKEIAVALKVPIGTVMSRISRGKEQLRMLLAKQVEQSVPERRQRGVL